MEINCQIDATDDFYCRSYCLLNMFRAPLCPSSGAREYYTSGCCLSYLVLWFSSCRYGVELRVMCPVCGLLQPKTCWASNKICNKNHLLHLVRSLSPHINDDARSKPHQKWMFNLWLSGLWRCIDCWWIPAVQSDILPPASGWRWKWRQRNTLNMSYLRQQPEHLLIFEGPAWQP